MSSKGFQSQSGGRQEGPRGEGADKDTWMGVAEKGSPPEGQRPLGVPAGAEETWLTRTGFSCAV